MCGIVREEQFFGTVKSPKLNISRPIYFKTISAHRFEDLICRNRLGQFFIKKKFF